jgi:hypothetical protein
MTTEAHSSTELIEIRQYQLHPGQRENLIDLFDHEFIETQEAVGMDVLGQFRDPERPDHFVWLRGFPNMTTRNASLTAFYDGPVWARHRDAANAAMIDSDNVLLLRAVTNKHALPIHEPSRRDKRTPSGLIVIVIEFVDREFVDHINDETAANFMSETIPALEHSGCDTLGTYITEETPNTFTRLSVRTDRAIVWIGAIETDDSSAVRHAIPPMPGRRQERYVLSPTTRSVLDGTTHSSFT